MPNSNKNKQQPKSKKKQNKPRTRGPTRGIAAAFGLDTAAIDHVRLMADPCNAKMVHPAYETPGGGALIRFRRVFTVGALAGETSGVVSWAPGANECFNNGAVTTVTPFTPFRQSVFPALGTGTNTSEARISFRCVAGCMKAITNASEANRSGLVYAGASELNQLWGNSAAPANGIDLNGIIPGLPISTRAPSKQMEVYWQPSSLDTHFWSDDSNTASAGGQGGRSTVTIAFSGAPAGMGYVIECTGVYEVIYPYNSGIVTAIGPPPSKSSWNLVLRGFMNLLHNSPVLIDGVRRATDYVSAAGTSYVGSIASRAAVSMLTL